MKKKELLLSGYEIMYDEDFMKMLYPVPHEVDVQLEDLYQLALKGRESGLKRILRLIDKYPQVPALKNYLSVLYKSMGKMEKAFEVNHWVIAEHPEYLFGKLNLAAEYFTNEEYDKIPEVLGEFMDLKKLYPERDTFHIAEVVSFFKISILYFSATGKFDEAEIRLDILRELAPESEDFEQAEEYFDYFKSLESIANLNKRPENEIRVTVNKTLLTEVTTPPEFTHPQINRLYESGFILDRQIIDEILALPRQSLINDLNKVLKDSIVRFAYFKTEFDDEFSVIHTAFLTHALNLLTEVEAVESVENILEILRQDEDFLYFFLDDVLTEHIWLMLYKTSSGDLSLGKQLMLEPGIYAFSKAAVSEMAVQFVLHQPERKEEVIEWFRNIFQFFLDSTPEDNVIDTALLGLMVNDVLDFKGTELMPEIEALYKREIVDLRACGDLEAVKNLFAEQDDMVYKRKLLSIYDIYDEFKSWYSYDGDDDDDDDDDDFDDFDFVDELDDAPNNAVSDGHPIQKPKKIGRNDPCPCGSGKKYKNCCMNKQKKTAIN